MTILPYTYKKVSDRLHVRVSNHFFYTDFGVRDSSEFRQYGRRYICTGTPGTGFIERESESHTYHEFVRSHLAAQRPSYIHMLLDREPNYTRELKRANEALHSEQDHMKRQILECYTNTLAIGKQEEFLQRVIRGVKDKMGHHQNKYMVSVISRYKRKIQQLEGDVSSVEYNVRDHCSPQVYEAYQAMCQAFDKMIHRCRRIWYNDELDRSAFQQVFFDMGVFDFIRSDTYLPMMRDSKGVTYFILPEHLIVARSSVDFDLVPLRSLNIILQELAMEEPTELLSSRLVDAACMIQMPAVGVSFYFNHFKVVAEFVAAYNHLKETL